jgi:hypothetical protein
MVVPCDVNNLLKVIESAISCAPGANNSARIAIAIAPPMNMAIIEKIRYNNPTSVW